MARNILTRMLSPLFAAATLVSFMACAPMQTEMSGDENTPVATVLRTAGLQNTVVVEGAHPTPYGLTSRDYTLENPYDLAPADQIIGRVIEEELASMPKEQVLVILSGENHDVSSHKMAHIGTLTHLVKMCDENPDDPARQFLFATELPFNYMEAGADFYKISVPAKLQYHLHEFDQDYRLAMTMEMADPRLKGSPQAMSRLFHAVLQHHIPAIFNDAAHRDGEEGRELDKKAPLSVAVRTVLDRFPDYTGWPIHVLSSAGVVGRNAEMVERAMAAAARKGIRIIFQETGGNHVFGHKWNSRHLEDSLAALYHKAGARVLAYLKPHDYDSLRQDIDPRAWKDFPNTVIIRHMAEETFLDNDPRSETAYIQRLADAYSNGPAPFDFDDPLPEPEVVKTQLQDMIRSALPPVPR